MSFCRADADLVPALLARLAEPAPPRSTRPGRTWLDNADEVQRVAGL